MKKTTFEWLKAGELDLKTMEKLLDDEFLTSVVAFHAQQLVEKTFKSLFEEKNIDIPKIHSLHCQATRFSRNYSASYMIN